MPRVEENPSFLDQLRALVWTGDSDRQSEDKLSLAFFFILGDKNDEDPLSQTDRLFQVIGWLADEGLIPALIDSSFLSYFYSQCYALGLCELLLERLQTVIGISSHSVPLSADSGEQGLAGDAKKRQLTVLAKEMKDFQASALKNLSGNWQTPNKTYRLSVSTFRANLDFFLAHLALTDLIPLLAQDQQQMTALLRGIQRKKPSVEGVAVGSPANPTLKWIDVLRAVLVTLPFSKRACELLKTFGASCDRITLDECPMALCVLPDNEDKQVQLRALEGKNLDDLLNNIITNLLSLASKKVKIWLLCGMHRMFLSLSSINLGEQLVVSKALLNRCGAEILSTLFSFYEEDEALDIGTQREIQESRQLIEAFRECQLLDTFTGKLNEYAEQIFQKDGEGEVGLASLYHRWVDQRFIRAASLAIYPGLGGRSNYPWTEFELYARELIRLFDLPSPNPAEIFKLYFEQIKVYLGPLYSLEEAEKLFDTVLLIAFTLSTNPDFQQAILAKMQAMQPSEAGTIPWYEYEDEGSSDGKSVLDRLGMRGNQHGLSLLLTTYSLSTSNISVCLLSAAGAGQLEIVKFLLNLEGENKPTGEAVGDALGAAARAGQPEIVKFLLNLEGENKPTAETVGWALSEAILTLEWGVVRLLMSLQGNNQPDIGALNSVLRAAVTAGQEEIVILLVDPFRLNKPDEWTVNYALSDAAGAGQPEIFLLLLRTFRLSEPAPWAVSSALSAAAHAREWGVVPLLVDSSRLHQPTADTVSSVLEAAAHAREWGVVRLLVSLKGWHKPKAWAVSSALGVAARAGQDEIILLLVDPSRSNKPDADAVSETLFSYAVPHQRWKIAHSCLLVNGHNMESSQLAHVIKAAIESLSVPTHGVPTPGLFQPRPERDPAASLCIQAALCAGTGLSVDKITISCPVESQNSPVHVMCAPDKETTMRDFLNACHLSFEEVTTDNGNTTLILNSSQSLKDSYSNIM